MAVSAATLNKTMLRLSGLSSGMDTESIVKSMLQIDQLKVDKQFQAKTKMEWKRDSLREINNTLRSFREKNMSVLAPQTNMMSTASYNIFKVTMDTASSAAVITAGAQANTGSMTINHIDQLATAASLRSGVLGASSISTGSALKDLALTTPLVFDESSGSKEIEFTINGESFTFGEDTSVQTMMSSINSNAKAGVNISYSSLTNRFSITAKTTGSASEITIDNIRGNAFSVDGAAFSIAEGTVNGQNAKLTIEGVAVEKESNNFTIDGITYSLKATTASAVAFTVNRDIDSAVSRIKTFIDNYNSLVETLQAKLSEASYKDFLPLTDEQRESLTETQAKQWDEKAKSGLLRNNSDISSFLDKIRSAFYSNVSSTGKNMSSIGLSTGNYTDKGKIFIDETKLRAALENNPDEVTRMFTSTSTSTDSATKFNESGLISRISDAMTSYTEKATSVSLETIDRAIVQVTSDMTMLTTRLNSKSEAYYKRFTAMETAMSKMNSQSSWLSSQLSSMSS